jgi:outer membrane immunogenic protein
MGRVSFRSGLLASGLVALVATAAITQVASAADLPVKASMYPAPAWSWTGLYVGVNAGYGAGLNRTTQTAGNSFVAVILTRDTMAPQGFVGGGQIGYNWQIRPNWLWGVEADFQGTGQKESTCSLECGLIALNASQKMPWLGTARLRLGYANGDYLWYVTGGGAWAKINSDYSLAGLLGPIFSDSASFSQTKGGFAAGAGVETHLAGSWSAKLEYMYIDLGTVSNAYATQFVAGGQVVVDSKIRNNIVRVGLNYKIVP